MTETILRLPDVIARTGLRRSSIYIRINRGEFRPLKLGPKSIGFLESEIEAWIFGRPRSRAKAHTE